jgi:antitoxin component YwqK of YwqJK toxin-antitoxin module
MIDLELYPEREIQVITETYDEEGRLHSRDGQPALVRKITIQQGLQSFVERSWYDHGKLHRGGPTSRKTTTTSRSGGGRYFPQIDKSIQEAAEEMERIDNAMKVRSFQAGEDLPAVTISNDKEILQMSSWYKEGVLHRGRDKPALIMYSDETDQEDVTTRECWYREGKLHRERDLPAEIRNDPWGENIGKYWYREGLPHRENNKPAREYLNIIENLFVQEWLVEGKHERGGGEPHVVKSDLAGVVVKKSWLDGDEKFHREGDLPAEIHYGETADEVILQAWYNHGRYHREDDQPAKIYVEEVEGQVMELREWYKEGVFFRENDEPHFEMWREDILVEKHWLEAEGKNHHEGDKPSMITLHPDTGNVDTEMWYRHGKVHRQRGPAIIEYDHDTQKPFVEVWLLDDRYQREDQTQPTEIYYDENGNIKEKHWLKNTPYKPLPNDSVLHRSGDKPAVILLDSEGRIEEEQWYVDGNLQRQDKPALITYYPSGVVHAESFFWEDNYTIDEEHPNYIEYDERGNVSLQRWYDVLERLHRVTGPAEIRYESGVIVSQGFFINGYERTTLEVRATYPLNDNIRVCERIFDPASGTPDFRQRLQALKKDCYRVESIEPCNEYYQSVIEKIGREYRGRELPSFLVTRGGELRDVITGTLPMITDYERWYIRFKDESGIDAGGLKRQLVLTLCKQIRPLFEYLNDKSSDPRMYISSEPDQTIVDKIGQGFTVGDLPVLYEFAGKVFANATINQYSTEIPLSRILLTAMVASDQGLERQNILMYYLLESDEEVLLETLYRKLPSDPEMVEEVVSDGANERYLFPGNPLKRSYIDSFINGFSEIGRKLAASKILPTELFVNVCPSNINEETFGEFLNTQVDFSMEGNRPLPEEERQLIIDTLTDKGGMLTGVLTTMTTVEFYKKLMKYWAETNVIDPSLQYSMRVYENVDYMFYPHTCGRTLDVNRNQLQDPVLMLNNLIAEIADKNEAFTAL